MIFQNFTYKKFIFLKKRLKFFSKKFFDYDFNEELILNLRREISYLNSDHENEIYLPRYFLSKVNLNYSNLIFISGKGFGCVMTLLIAGLEEDIFKSKNAKSFGSGNLFVSLNELSEPIKFLLRKRKYPLISIYQFSQLKKLKTENVWLHAYNPIPDVIIKFLESDKFKNIFYYSDGLKNKTNSYQAEKVSIPDGKFLRGKNSLIYKASMYIYFGWNNDDSSNKKEKSYIFEMHKLISNYNKYIENLALNFNYLQYINELSMTDCNGDHLIIFARYLGTNSYTFKNKECMTKFFAQTANLLKSKVPSKFVYLITDERCDQTYIEILYQALMDNFDDCKTVNPGEISQQLPGEIISYFISKHSPNSFIFSFDGSMSLASKMLKCKNSIYLDYPDEISKYFTYKETSEMFLKQSSIYKNCLNDIKL